MVDSKRKSEIENKQAFMNRRNFISQSIAGAGGAFMLYPMQPLMS